MADRAVLKAKADLVRKKREGERKYTQGKGGRRFRK